MVLPPGELVQTVVVYRGLIRGCSLTSTILAGFFFFFFSFLHMASFFSVHKMILEMMKRSIHQPVIWESALH